MTSNQPDMGMWVFVTIIAGIWFGLIAGIVACWMEEFKKGKK